MSRKPRLHVPGGFFHVILRGNARQNIFSTVRDRDIWEALVGDALARYGHRIHAYCWMTNHIHIAIQSGAEPLARFMAYLASNYARRFNLRVKRSGHLFERRYRAILVNEDEYLRELVRYIHMNPVRAKMVAHCSDYAWSSHNAYMCGQQPEWLTSDVVLGMFGASEASARKIYAAFTNEPVQQSITQLLRAGSDRDARALGSDNWLNQLGSEIGELPAKLTLDELVTNHCLLNDIAQPELHDKSRARNLTRIRAEIALDAIEHGIATISEVARHFGRSQPALSRTIKRLRDGRNKL
jgi:putative transposase